MHWIQKLRYCTTCGQARVVQLFIHVAYLDYSEFFCVMKYLKCEVSKRMPLILHGPIYTTAIHTFSELCLAPMQ